MRTWIAGLSLLALASWLPAAAEDEKEPAAPALTPWAAYRQALRDTKKRPYAANVKHRRALKQRPGTITGALAWLAASQRPDGKWQADKVANGPGRPAYDVGLTGLALTAFLVAGYDGKGDHEFDEPVEKGLAWLAGAQDKDGCYDSSRGIDPATQVPEPRPRTRGRFVAPISVTTRDRTPFVYNHAAATIAMLEAYGLTGEGRWKTSAQKALAFIDKMRNPYFCWRYGVKPGNNDTSVTGWMLMPLFVARSINEQTKAAGKPATDLLQFDEQAFEGVKMWQDKMTDPDYGRVGYILRGTGPARPPALVDRFPGEKSESMTALGLWTRTVLGEDPRKSKIIELQAELCAKLPPTWNESDGSIDFIYWHWGALAMHQVTGKHRKTWMAALEIALIEHQRRDGRTEDVQGSWDPVDVWGMVGGRVYATAINLLTLLTRERFATRAKW